MHATQVSLHLSEKHTATCERPEITRWKHARVNSDLVH